MFIYILPFPLIFTRINSTIKAFLFEGLFCCFFFICSTGRGGIIGGDGSNNMFLTVYIYVCKGGSNNMGINKDMNDLLMALNMESKGTRYQVVITTSYNKAKHYIKKQFEVQKIKKIMSEGEDGKKKSVWVKEQGWYTKDIFPTVLCLNEQLQALREENAK